MSGDALTAAIVRISDAAVRGEHEDLATPFTVEKLEAAGISVMSKALVRDDVRYIAEAVQTAAIEQVDFILTVGGIGVSPLDYTARAMDPIFRLDIPGIPEAIRAVGLVNGDPLATLWRNRAGVLVAGRRRIFVVNSSGSRAGVTATLQVVLPILPKIIQKINGSEN
ncbi:MAG: molybdopterin-binding protein [Actinomycetaceae bacterium]|nr:molybdopterin-binding protein [Actinomycetaceae bacterium]MDY5273450.1 molybdopterin-binding protein [Arcanobacterium sp.]